MTDQLRSVAAALVGDDTTIAECSTVELLTVALTRFNEHRDAQNGQPAGREFALAITNLEDAITRWNKGIYLMHGTFAISDAERQQPPEGVEF